MNWMMHHTYSDAWSLGIVLRDLEALLEDADRDLPPAPGFLPLARRLATRATGDQDAINTYWREYAHPHAKEVRLLKLPPQSLSTSVATSLDQEVGIPHGKKCRAFPRQRGDAISVHFGYDRKRYYHETVVDLREHFVAVLQALCSGGTNLDVATFLTKVSQGTHLDW